jgi:hypothetical protein
MGQGRLHTHRGEHATPPPEGFVSPVTWGLEDNVLERFAGAGIPHGQVSFSRETYRFVYGGPPTELVAAFRSYYGPTMNAFEAAEAAGRADGRRRRAIRALAAGD